VTSAASGEQSALRGYHWQYDQLAAIAYAALCDGTFVSIRLADPFAGKVDDLVLVDSSGTTGHQFKSRAGSTTLTLNDLTKPGRTRGGAAAPSMFAELAAGWRAIAAETGDTTVRLITDQPASTRGIIALAEGTSPPPRRAMADLIADVLTPIRRGDLALADVPACWHAALDEIKTSAGLGDDEFEVFLRSLDISVSQPNPLESPNQTRRRDIADLSKTLSRTVAEAKGVVVLDRHGLFELMTWQDRARLRSSHEFPVDIETYEPLDAAAEELDKTAAAMTRGYVALLGPPGAGKSTLLQQSFLATADRVIRYYAFVPGPGRTRNRLEAEGFLHDVVMMLERAESSPRVNLIERSRAELRTAFGELLDRATTNYTATGQRTIMVVDGLDHVQREHVAAGGFLEELPAPESIPDGVVIVVGSRTLEPLPPEARTQLESGGRTVDLESHRLTHQGVLAVCERASQSAELGVEVHKRIAELAAGHPLSLAYLLNRVSEATDVEDALIRLSGVVRYEGEIAAEYRAVWEALADKPSSQELLAISARIRIPFVTSDIIDWFDMETARTFRDGVSHLFRATSEGWTIFHDSFRQFVIEHSNAEPKSDDPAWDVAYQRVIAEHCANSTRPRFRWEELHHRHLAGDDISALATQAAFRQQLKELRPISLIRDDLRVALGVAAEKHDLRQLLNMLLAKVEAESRWGALETVDGSRVFLDAGLVSEAIAYASVDLDRQVPLAHAYRLASALGARGNSDGRRIFDAVERLMFDDERFATYAGHQNDVYFEWGYAAPFYRSLPALLKIIATLRPGTDTDGEPHQDFRRREEIVRFTGAVDAVADALAELARNDDLLALDRFLVTGQDKVSPEDMTPITDSRLHLLELRLASAVDEAGRVEVIQRALDISKGRRLYIDTLLSWAEEALDANLDNEAGDLLARTSLDNQLETSDLGHSKDDAVIRRFRYWRMRHRLLWRAGPGPHPVLDSVKPSPTTPAGNSIDPAAAVHRFNDAISATAEVDRAVRTLAAIAAASDDGEPFTAGEVEAALVTVLAFGAGRDRRGSATADGVLSHRSDLLRVALHVALVHGDDTALGLMNRLATRFAEEPSRWHLDLRRRLGRRFHAAGMTPDWYIAAITAAEQDLVEGDLDVSSRLDLLAELAADYVDLDRTDDAQRLARLLVPLSFGVGYRKDHQFDRWVQWFADAVAAGLPDPVDEALAFARLLVAAAPMTEGAPRDAAVMLPPALVGQAPGPAVALFEYFVRTGTVHHMEALSALVAGFAAASTSADAAMLVTAADLIADVISRTSSVAYPKCASSVTAALRATVDEEHSERAIARTRDQVAQNALPTQRRAWLEALGLPQPDPEPEPEPAPPVRSRDWGESTYGSLTLADGTLITEHDAASQLIDADAVVRLRGDESPDSTFSWAPHVKRLELTAPDVTSLAAAFDRTSRRDNEAIAVLAERALAVGEQATALELAKRVLETEDLRSWSSSWGGTRRRAHRVALSAGGRPEKDFAWTDFAAMIAEDRFGGEFLLRELAEILALLDPHASAADLWPSIRFHLDGMSEPIALDDTDPIGCQPARWWLPTTDPHLERFNNDQSLRRAFAGLAVDHATHLTWLVRDGAATVAKRAIDSGYGEIEDAVETVIAAAPADDIVEGAARCLPRSTKPIAFSKSRKQCDQVLGQHPNRFVRELAAHPMSPTAPLPPRYSIDLPPSNGPVLGATEVNLGPYEGMVRYLAHVADLNESDLIEHALLRVRDERLSFPTDPDLRKALSGAGLNFRFPMASYFISRSVVGRMVDEWYSAGLLGVRDRPRMTRSFDPDLFDQNFVARPIDLTPTQPPAGHDPRLSIWLAEIEARLDAYVIALGGRAHEVVIAATAAANVLNWGYLEEDFTCCLRSGDFSDADQRHARPAFELHRQLADLAEKPAKGSESRTGQAMAIQNFSPTFQQHASEWIAFSPLVAAHLCWTPDAERPGTWLTGAGDVAVYSIRWSDGWPGRGERMFDDVESGGQLVVASSAGWTEMVEAFGEFTRVSRLDRRGRDSNGETDTEDEATTHRADAFPTTIAGA
jgi:hypothetical protein